MYKGSWTKNVFLFGISLLIMYVIVFILGLFNYCSWFINCYQISPVHYADLLSFWYQTSTTMGNYEMQERWLLRGWFCTMWFKSKAAGCCAASCWLSWRVAWWCGGAVMLSGTGLLGWLCWRGFQESVSVLSHPLVMCHTSNIVVYSMLC